jgi:hypothetical protein
MLAGQQQSKPSMQQPTLQTRRTTQQQMLHMLQHTPAGMQRQLSGMGSTMQHTSATACRIKQQMQHML